MILTADQILATVDEAAWLAPHLEANSQVLRWAKAEAAVLRGLGGPVPEHIPNGVPLLKYASGDDAVSLLDAVLNPPQPHDRGFFDCDIDRIEAKTQNILWVPCGASVVQLRVRNAARSYLADITTNLVWF